MGASVISEVRIVDAAATQRYMTLAGASIARYGGRSSFVAPSRTSAKAIAMTGAESCSSSSP